MHIKTLFILTCSLHFGEVRGKISICLGERQSEACNQGLGLAAIGCLSVLILYTGGNGRCHLPALM